jgi:peptidoglycan/LPS O-acetylase OafA/YrhL
MNRNSSLTYYPEIDGLRALAVLPVLLFHAGFGFPGGFAGVDVFFVISGFLIGSVIVKEVAAGQFSLLSFWIRRIRRLLPAWALVVLVTSWLPHSGWSHLI